MPDRAELPQMSEGQLIGYVAPLSNEELKAGLERRAALLNKNSFNTLVLQLWL